MNWIKEQKGNFHTMSFFFLEAAQAKLSVQLKNFLHFSISAIKVESEYKYPPTPFSSEEEYILLALSRAPTRLVSLIKGDFQT